MQWTCVSCGTPNTGGIFCISCGTKVEPQQQVLHDAVPPPLVAAPQGQPHLPGIVAGVTVAASLVLGVWQNSQVIAAENEVDSVVEQLREAINDKKTAETLSDNAEYEADVCYYNDWCSYYTYSVLLDDAESARDLVYLAQANVNELNAQVDTARADLARHENIRNIGIGLGGVASVGAVSWALVASRKSSNNNAVSFGS